MSDELRRRFQDKIQGRPPLARRSGGQAGQETVPPDTLLVHHIEHGALPSALPLNPLFRKDRHRLRLTLDLGSDLRRRVRSLSPAQREALLSFSPRLDHHDCCLGLGLGALLTTGADGRSSPAATDADGLALAHLIEHLALELLTEASAGRECHGATCALADRAERFDLFLEVSDPLLGRTAAILAAVMARDACASLDRLDLHLRTRDLLIALATGDRTVMAPEDVAIDHDWTVTGAREALAALVRIGYLEARVAPLTFSSTAGILYRRVDATPSGTP